MNQKPSSIAIYHIVLLLMTSIGLKNHVTIIPHTIQAGGRDAWVSVILAFLLVLLWGLLVIYILKGTGQTNFYKWSQNNIGKKAGFMLSATIYLYFILATAATIKEMIIWTRVTYLPEVSLILLVIVFTLVCFFLAMLTIGSIAITNTILLFFVIILGFFVAFTNLQVKDYSLLRPLFAEGYGPVLDGVIYPFSAFVEILMLILLQTHSKKRLRYKHLIIIITILVILTLGPLIGAIIEFGPVEAARQHYPAYEEWGLVSLGRFFEHVDFFSIYQWLTGAFIRTSLFLFFMNELFQVKKAKSKAIFTAINLLIITILLSLPITDFDYFMLMKKIFLPANVYFYLLLSVLLAIITFISRRKQGGTQGEAEKIPKA